jgi:hypothetical protein
MRRVTPYKTYAGLERALDNGGRAFDLTSHARDGQVTVAELRAAAGSARDPLLFLSLAWWGLDDNDRGRIRRLLPGQLQRELQRSGPTVETLSELRESKRSDVRVIVEGFLMSGESGRREWQLRSQRTPSSPGVVVLSSPRATVPRGRVRIAGVWRWFPAYQDRRLDSAFYSVVDELRGPGGELLDRDPLRDALTHRVT